MKFINIDQVTDIIDNKYPEILSKYVNKSIDTYLSSILSKGRQEQMVVSVAAAHLCYVRYVLKDKETIDDDVFYDSTEMANMIIKNVIANYALDSLTKDCTDKIQKIRKSRGIPDNTKIDDIEDKDTRESLEKSIGKVTDKFLSDSEEIEKKIIPYEITKNLMSCFKKKAMVRYDALSKEFLDSILQAKFPEKKADEANIKNFKDSIISLFDIYDIQNEKEAFILLQHMFVNIKRNINHLAVKNQQMYCFCGSGEMTGKTAFCNSIWRVSANKRNLEDEDINATTTKDIRFEKLLDKFGSPETFKYPIIHIDEKTFFENNQEEKLKSLITSPVVQVERKGCDAVDVENRSTVIVSLNDSADMIIHDNTKERRRAIIEFPDKDGDILKTMTTIELDTVVENILLSAPTEYYYDVNIVNKIATERKGVDNIIEAFVCSLELNNFIKEDIRLTAAQWAEAFPHGTNATAPFLRNYMKRHSDLFESSVAHHGCVYFRATDALRKIIEEKDGDEEKVQSADTKKHVIQFKM